MTQILIENGFSFEYKQGGTICIEWKIAVKAINHINWEITVYYNDAVAHSMSGTGDDTPYPDIVCNIHRLVTGEVREHAQHPDRITIPSIDN